MPGEPLRCRCDGGAYEVKKSPFLVHPDCPIHSAKAEPLRPTLSNDARELSMTLEEALMLAAEKKWDVLFYGYPYSVLIQDDFGDDIAHEGNWPESFSVALDCPVVARDDTAELIAQLAECCRLSGADTGDDEDWRLAPRAIQEVRQLRQDYDELSQTEGELVEALEAFFEASDNYMPEQDGFYQEALTNLRAAFVRVKGEQP